MPVIHAAYNWWVGRWGHVCVTLKPLRSWASQQLAANGRRRQTQVAFLWITMHFWATHCFSDQLGTLGRKPIQYTVTGV